MPALFNLARGSGRRRQKEEKKGLPALFNLLEVLEGAGKRRRRRVCLRFLTCWRFWKAQAKGEKQELPALFCLLEVPEGAGKGGEVRVACAF